MPAKKRRRNNAPTRPKKRVLSPEEERAFTDAGLDVSGLMYVCRGDMTMDGCYRDTWAAFDGKGVYYAEGEVTISPRKKKNSKIPEVQIRIDTVEALPIGEVDRLECEQFVSTGRLVASQKGEYRTLSRFSIGCVRGFHELAKAYCQFKETGQLKLPPEPEEEKVCRKCGAPAVPGKDLCETHVKNSATAVRLFRFFGGYVPQIAAVLFFMLLESGLSVFLPQISTRALFDDILGKSEGRPLDTMLSALTVLVLSIFGLSLLRIVFRVIQQYVTASIMPKVTYDIKLRIFSAMQRLSLSFYSSKQTGSLMERVSRDTRNIYWFFLDGIPSIIISVATIVGVLVVMFLMNWKLSLIALAAFPPILAVLVAGENRFRSMHHRTWVFSSKVSSMVSDNINGQRVIKAFSKEEETFSRFERVSDDFRKSELRLSLFEATVFPMVEIFIMLLSAVVLGVGGVMVAKGTLKTGALLSFVVYLEMLRDPFDFLSWVSNWWSRCADSAQRVFEICDSDAEIKEKPDAVPLENMRGEVDIRELEFEYEPARPVIKKMDLHVDAGEMLGIVGKTGAGKTTIANLIARLYDAGAGAVKIDGTDVRDLRLKDLRANIGVVSQDIYLFIGTVADNIRYARPDATMAEVIAAAKAASAHDFIMKLPDAYETRIGAGGRKLSGGETQRISIARTIIQNPRILILDEATAAMDTETERNIQKSIAALKQGRTTVAIAHRLSTLRDADRLAVIDEGTVVETGTFRELITQKGEFFRLYKIQTEALKEAGILSDAPSEDEGDEDDE